MNKTSVYHRLCCLCIEKIFSVFIQMPDSFNILTATSMKKSEVRFIQIYFNIFLFFTSLVIFFSKIFLFVKHLAFHSVITFFF